MIVSITGKIAKKNPKQIIIDLNGLGYLCHISTNTFDNLPLEGEVVSLLTYYSVSEHNQELYAFFEELERNLFIMLIGVSGIGPKTAIGLLAAVTPEEFKRRLIAGEVGMLTALPGIGPKTARRIIVELKDKFVKLGSEELPVEDNGETSSVKTEVFQALETLGYKTIHINKILREITKENSNLNTQEIIKIALTKL